MSHEYRNRSESNISGEMSGSHTGMGVGIAGMHQMSQGAYDLNTSHHSHATTNSLRTDPNTSNSRRTKTPLHARSVPNVTHTPVQAQSRTKKTSTVSKRTTNTKPVTEPRPSTAPPSVPRTHSVPQKTKKMSAIKRRKQLNEQTRANELLSSGISPYYNHNVPPNPAVYNSYPPQPPVTETPESMYMPSEDTRMHMLANNSMNTSVLSTSTPTYAPMHNSNPAATASFNRNVIYIPTGSGLSGVHSHTPLEAPVHHPTTSTTTSSHPSITQRIPVVSNKNPGNGKNRVNMSQHSNSTGLHSHTKRLASHKKPVVNMIQKNIDNINLMRSRVERKSR